MRFAFGKNWRSFLDRLDDDRISESVRALTVSLDRARLDGLRVLDIGSGSGLSSLAFRRLGADVTSFDYDEDSVACTRLLRDRFYPEASEWRVAQGSVLDETYMSSLGTYDIVYAWGVLHHTGAMWRAIDQAAARVQVGGTLVVAIYNDQGWRSRLWLSIKRLYCSGWAGRTGVVAVFYPLFAAYALGLDLRRGRMPGTHAREYARHRGMSLVHDWKDWLGGYPFEVASPDAMQGYLQAKGLQLRRKTTTRGWGCNELVLTRQEQETHG